MTEADLAVVQGVTVLDRLAAIPLGESGTVECLVVSPRPGEHRLVPEIRVIPGVGVVGDHGGKQFWRGRRIPGREVSAMNVEVLETLGIVPAVPGDNLILRGIDLRALEPGAVVRAGEVSLRRTATAHHPCRLFRDRTSEVAFQLAREGWRGVLLEPLVEGVIRVGDPVQIVPTSCAYAHGAYGIGAAGPQR